MNNNIHQNTLKQTTEPAKRASPGRVGRRAVLQTGLGLAVLTTGIGTFFELEKGFAYAEGTVATSPSSTNVVIQWNNAALQAIRTTNPGPTVASRALAIMHTCMYDAWTPYDSNAVPTQPNNGISKKSIAVNSDITNSISYAAYRALMDLFPTQATIFNSLMQSLGYDPNNTSTDMNTPTGIGNVAANAVIGYRHSDGSNQLGNLNQGTPYSDYTGYTPVNTPNSINDPNRWQPLYIPKTGVTQKYLTPQWGQVTPFALTSASQFRPSGPYLYTSGQQNQDYTNQVNTILSYSAGLNDTEKAIAYYWANGPHSETPPGHWALLAQVVSQQHNYDTSTNVKLFFALSNALLDAGIACWDCKRAYDSVRPITAVHFVCTGQQVQAWGGIGQATASMDGSQWMPYQEASVVTPPFPEYVSGHSTFSAAGAYILRKFTGTDSFNSSYTVPADSSVIEPGIAPSTDITLSWATFTDAANQAGLSRQYGGIHFNKGDMDGRVLGANVGAMVWNKAQSYINGNFSPGPIDCFPYPGSIQSNFNGTPIAGGNCIWFTSVLKVNGLPTTGPTTVSFTGQTIQFSANGTDYVLSVSDAAVTFDPSATTASTSFDTSTKAWMTTVPSNIGGNTYLSGLALLVPGGGLPGGINPVTWSGKFSSTSPKININWQWAAAVYTQFNKDSSQLGVKSVDDNQLSQYKNSDHAGTPENYKSYVIGGAGGGGGSNYTGGLSGTASVQGP